ncbi:MAG: hypothetical protein M3203_05490 [Actinomycetota bacterium]|nr:hypothetical protein [Actinomycetota bacterium]
MAQPDYVPASAADRVRAPERLPPSKRWYAERPGEIKDLRPPTGRRFGKPGPDQGYALTLAERFMDQLQLAPHEHAADAVAGCVGVANRRAALYGRAPVIHDLDHAFTLWGFLGEAPQSLVTFRRRLFEGASHHYFDQRDIVDRVPDATLRMTPDEVRQQISGWKSLIRTDL